MNAMHLIPFDFLLILGVVKRCVIALTFIAWYVISANFDLVRTDWQKLFVPDTEIAAMFPQSTIRGDLAMHNCAAGTFWLLNSKVSGQSA